MTSQPEHLVVLDLASLRLHRTGNRVDVLTCAGELICSVRASDGEPARLVAFRAFNAALEHRLPRAFITADGHVDLVAAAVALYNPATGQVAVGAIGKDTQDTATFSDGRPLPLSSDGETATCEGAELHIGERRLRRAGLKDRSLGRELQAHRVPVAA